MKELLTSNTSGILTSRTIWIFLALFIASILNQMKVIDVPLDAEATWVTTVLSVVGIILRMITKKPVWQNGELDTYKQ